MSLFSIFLFVVILLALVVVHELGHFLAAKALGIRVDEFAFGFPPKIFSKKYGETTYVLNALPLGGYVKIYGEDGSDEHSKDSRSFASKKWWKQLIVLVAGVTMNMLFALIVLIALSLGKTEVYEGDALFARATEKKLIVTEVIETGPAFTAGIKEGDEIVSLKGKTGMLTSPVSDEAIAFIQKNQGGVAITYINDKQKKDTVTLAPVYGIVKDKKAIGVGLATVGMAQLSFLEAVQKGTRDTVNMTLLMYEGFKQLFSGKNVLDQVTGPVGLVKIVHKEEQKGLASVAFLAAILSINLAFFNILPFPALDGGRSVIVIGEAIARRKINKTFFARLNASGFIFLMIVFVIVFIKDIIGVIH